ncbi:MAG: carboxypeptidase-like regulatory domain-containing protein, partial [Myxococcota bacterium]
RDAVEQFRQALSHWQNAKLHVYLSLALTRVGQPVDAYEHLQRAQELGLHSIHENDRAWARELHNELLSQHIALIEIHCSEPGVKVNLDGKSLVIRQGTSLQAVVPGAHLVEASKSGYFPVTQSVTVVAGQRSTVTLTMAEDRVLKKRRWARSRPWMVVGAGVAVGLGGGALLALAKRNSCDGLVCLSNSPSYRRAESRQQLPGIATLAASGAVLVAGLLMVGSNRPRPYRSENRGGTRLEITPLISPQGVGMSGGWSF